MKKTNLYYGTIHKRKAAPKEFVMLGLLFFISWPRMIIEVFIRKNFGERYFSLPAVVALSVVMFLFPFGFDRAMHMFTYRTNTYIVLNNLSWYLFIIAFFYFGLQRQKEIKREPGTFDFAKFSPYEGDIHPFFKSIKIKNAVPNRRQISILLEPALFFALGIVLVLLQQKLGGLFIFASLCYAASYNADYLRGDHYILDVIDEKICNEEFAKSFMTDEDPQFTRGFHVPGGRSENMDFRRKVVDSMFDDDEAFEAF